MSECLLIGSGRGQALTEGQRQSRQSLPLHLDENANETIFIIVGVIDGNVPSMNQTEAAVWSVRAPLVEGKNSELSTSANAACIVLAITRICIGY